MQGSTLWSLTIITAGLDLNRFTIGIELTLKAASFETGRNFSYQTNLQPMQILVLHKEIKRK